MKAEDYPERIYVNNHNSGMYKDWGAEPLETEHIGNVLTMQYDNIEYIRADIVSNVDTSEQNVDTLEQNVDTSEQVNHPAHYQGQGGMEAIDAMIGVYGKEETAAFCKLNAAKYIMRLGKKGDAAEDARKAVWYLNKFIELTSEL